MADEYEERTMVYLPDTSIPSARHRSAPLSVHIKTLKHQEHQLLLTGPEGAQALPDDTLLDALPYVDMQYNDPAIRSAVENLIAEEMGRSTKAPEEYLADKGMADDYEFDAHGSAFLQTEWDRVSEGRPQTPLDTSAYKVEPPPEAERDSLAAWQKAVDNAHAQLEHTHTRILNLELLNRFGPNAWKMHTEQLTSFKTAAETRLSDCKQDIENLNRKRKAEQLNTAANLRQLEHKWATSIAQANELEGVCHVLEKEVKRLKKRAEKKGLLKEATAGKMDTA